MSVKAAVGLHGLWCTYIKAVASGLEGRKLVAKMAAAEIVGAYIKVLESKRKAEVGRTRGALATDLAQCTSNCKRSKDEHKNNREREGEREREKKKDEE